MAKANLELVMILRLAAQRLENSQDYQWGHMGSCNCGFVAQEITHLSKDEIHRKAMEGHGDWTEQLNDYCPASGLPLEGVIEALLRSGLEIDDLKHLERLSDPIVLKNVPQSRSKWAFNERKNAIAYLRAWASLLEDELLAAIEINPNSVLHEQKHRSSVL